MSEPTLSINCFLLGSDPRNVVTVNILKTENVCVLKELIKEKLASHLNHVRSASDLAVWKVSIPVDAITPELTVDDVELHSVKKISSIFREALVDEHVHILVQVQGPTAPDPAQLLSLNCVLFRVDEKLDQHQFFPVEILKTAKVSTLRHLIAEELRLSFHLNRFTARKVILSQVSLPVDNDLEESLKNVDLAPLTHPFLPLSEVFPRVEEKYLHVIVQVPNDEGFGTEDAGEEGRRDQIPVLHKRFQNTISRILKATPPAESAKSSNYTKSQMAYSISDGRYKAGRPRTSVAPPVQLFNPVFGHFLDHMRSNQALSDDIILQAAGYMKAASAIYESEGQRRNALLPLLCAILDVNIQTILNEDKTNPDGIVEVVKNMFYALVYLQEDKNEMGDGASDPSTQAGLSAGRCWAQSRYEVLRNATACPTFLVATAGPWIAILAAVITDGVIVQRLTDYIWVGMESVLSESHITRVARVFHALKASLKKLKSYYESLDLTADSLADMRYFPSITAYCPHGSGRVKFRYVGFLENSPDCITLHARTETMPVQDIVVKFVDRYGQMAHEMLAAQGLAPKLLYYGSPRLDDDEPSYRSISMVVMEYVEGDTFAVAKQKMSEESVETVRLAVQCALGLLHDHGLVFGDLRPPNIMITKGGEVKLIDFNWAGEEGQAKYPSLISPEIAWPEGVKPLAVMRREHDLDMLSKLI